METNKSIEDIDAEGYVTFSEYPILGDIVSFIEENNIQAPYHLTRFNAYLLHERSRRFWQRDQWRLASPVVYLSNIPKPRTLYVVPKNFVTDGASVPCLPLLYYFFGRVGRRSATIHDWLYRQGSSHCPGSRGLRQCGDLRAVAGQRSRSSHCPGSRGLRLRASAVSGVNPSRCSSHCPGSRGLRLNLSLQHGNVALQGSSHCPGSRGLRHSPAIFTRFKLSRVLHIAPALGV
jgi:hypothetical protein